MLDLDQAIELATKAHKDQWKNVALYQSTQTIDEVKALHPDDKFEKTFLANVYNRSKPYITHPLAVMEMMSTEEEKIVAVLHDVIENCKGYYLYAEHAGSVYYLTKENNNDTVCLHLTKEIYEALVLLTHSKDISYSKYIIDLVKNKLATKVKIADIVCNLADNPSEYAKQNYLKTLPILLKGI